ncbi:YybH family protein [Nocardiopsis baichengensis]|uniref:YybH family protein n=1 Tax=Nocardiopsis baichengensis TaxID=280240 RepID=UPI001EF9F076|nr:SgcJ/EcaC family oxidoreductase [Nocardiopsis baichengensis]
MDLNEQHAIEDLVAAHTRLWIDHDMDAWGAYFTEDADFITHRGLWWRTRAENVDGHKDVPASVLAQKADYTQEVASVREIAPDVALVHTLWTWPGHRLPGARPAEDRSGIITLVLVRRDGEWRIRAAHNTRDNGRDDFAPEAAGPSGTSDEGAAPRAEAGGRILSASEPTLNAPSRP